MNLEISRILLSKVTPQMTISWLLSGQDNCHFSGLIPTLNIPSLSPSPLPLPLPLHLPFFSPHIPGVFVTLFMMAYLISPRFCHRFVGYLEEEAVKTYTLCLEVRWSLVHL